MKLMMMHPVHNDLVLKASARLTYTSHTHTTHFRNHSTFQPPPGQLPPKSPPNAAATPSSSPSTPNSPSGISNRSNARTYTIASRDGTPTVSCSTCSSPRHPRRRRVLMQRRRRRRVCTSFQNGVLISFMNFYTSFRDFVNSVPPPTVRRPNSPPTTMERTRPSPPTSPMPLTH